MTNENKGSGATFVSREGVSVNVDCRGNTAKNSTLGQFHTRLLCYDKKWKVRERRLKRKKF